MRSSRGLPRSSSWFGQSRDVDLGDFHRIIRPIVAWIRCLARDLLHEFYALRRALAKNCVMSVQMWRGYFRDKELRPIRIRSGVGHRKTSGHIEI